MTDWNAMPDVGAGRCACGAPLVKMTPMSVPACVRSGWAKNLGCGRRGSPSAYWLVVEPGAMPAIAQEAIRNARTAYRQQRAEDEP